ncbi:MAG TPA: protein kinase [Kofleriaceae bacterium]|nr:protein kinase [Kofleriaceae bacterium]
MVPTASSAVVQPRGEPASFESASDDALPPGAKAGPWVVERELGRGGMGAVYGVVHEEIGKRAALKVMHSRLVSGSSMERILLEAKVVNAVGHPNIVDIFETGTLDDGRPYIVMERLEGVPLSFRADEGKILPDQVIGILLQVCDALIAAHAANIVHRDLKLDNVFLIDNVDDPSSPRVKLLDWGIAKVISNDVRHTIEGQLVGTPQYLAPEQARGAAVSPATDVYSLGVMAYELFLEQLPFEAETSAEIMAMHLRCTPPPPSELWPDIPATLEHLLLAMLEKNADDRPSMLTVAHTLERVRADLDARRQPVAETTAARTPTVPPLRRSSRHDVGHRSSNQLAQAFNGFSPTEPAAWPETRRHWHVAIGALAVAASAAMFLLTRNTERAAAAAPKREAVVEQVTATTEPAPPSPVAPDAPDIAPPSREPSPAVIPAAFPIDPYADAADTEATAIKPAVLRSSAASKRSHSHTRKQPVKPRRSPQPLDPDGTLDPYL